MTQTVLRAVPAVLCGVQVSGLELSLVDERPQELLVATLDGLSAEHHVGITTAGGAAHPYAQSILRVRNLQVGMPHVCACAHPLSLPWGCFSQGVKSVPREGKQPKSNPKGLG